MKHIPGYIYYMFTVYILEVFSHVRGALATAVWLSFVYVLRPLTACPNWIKKRVPTFRRC
jgi:hypothetical protein